MRAISIARGVLRVALLLILLPLSAVGAADPLWHIIAKGETLYSVSRLYGVSPAALMAVNGIKDPARLAIGQRILVPSIHRVAKGETLYGIARLFGTTVPELLRLNGLGEGAVIRPGDLLVVPSGTAVATKPDPAPSAGAGTIVTAGKKSEAGSARSGSIEGSGLQKVTVSLTTVPPGAKSNAISTSGSKSPDPLQPLGAAPSQARKVSAKALLPCAGEARYLEGKVFGIAIKAAEGTAVKAVAGGTVVSAGPYRGFGSVAFVQARNGLIFVYGGNSTVSVRVGDFIKPGLVVGKVGHDPLGGATEAYFFVFKGEEALDPVSVPRE